MFLIPFKILILLGFVRLLREAQKPFWPTVLYIICISIFSLLFAEQFILANFLISLAIRFVLTYIYFALLIRTQDSFLYYIICILGFGLGLF